MTDLSKLAETMTRGLLGAVSRKLRHTLAEPPQQAALRRCYRAGLAALLPADDPRHEEYLPVWQAFFALSPVQVALAQIWRGQEPDLESLIELFTEEVEGCDLPSFDIETGLARLIEAFRRAVAQESDLREFLSTPHRPRRPPPPDLAQTGYAGDGDDEKTGSGDISARDIDTHGETW